MRVSKWGNSLAVRLPAAFVKAFELKEGDQIEIQIAQNRASEQNKHSVNRRVLACLRKLRRLLPPGFVFRREQDE